MFLPGINEHSNKDYCFGFQSTVLPLKRLVDVADPLGDGGMTQRPMSARLSLLEGATRTRTTMFERTIVSRPASIWPVSSYVFFFSP